MSKYTVTVTFSPITLDLDTASEEFKEVFAAYKDELVDKCDPADPDAIRDLIIEDPELFGIDQNEIEFEDVKVTPRK